jgi:predicted NBD/HSP70 family sugar kinase
MVAVRRIVGVDLGGHGAAAALVEVDRNGARIVSDRREWQPSSVGELASLATDAFGLFDGFGLSTAGFVEHGSVTLCRAQPWIQGHTQAKLEHSLPRHTQVRVINDGEAHTWAAAFGRRLGARHPLLSFSIGTSVGFGKTDSAGRIELPTSARNWDIGSMRIRTRCSNPEIWWACGSNGLAELETSFPKGQAVQHFGSRVGALITDFSVLFQPSAVVLSGGVPAKFGDELLGPAIAELRATMPPHTRTPVVELSPHGRNAGIVGAAISIVG